MKTAAAEGELKTVLSAPIWSDWPVKLPLESKRCKRPFPESATYTVPKVDSTAMPLGRSKFPVPVPRLPHWVTKVPAQVVGTEVGVGVGWLEEQENSCRRLLASSAT